MIWPNLTQVSAQLTAAAAAAAASARELQIGQGVDCLSACKRLQHCHQSSDVFKSTKPASNKRCLRWNAFNDSLQACTWANAVGDVTAIAVYLAAAYFMRLDPNVLNLRACSATAVQLQHDIPECVQVVRRGSHFVCTMPNLTEG